MLMQLSVKNLAIVTELQLEFTRGMHVITGETGAGKSIIIDALGLALGERASAEQIRPGCQQAEVTACFVIDGLPRVQELLAAQDLPNNECVIRRIISVDGRSRAYLNGHLVALQQIKILAPYLVHIHSQHQHHALLQADYQRELLDAYADNHALLTELKTIYNNWHKLRQELLDKQNAEKNADKLALLEYQLQEIDNLQLQPNELASLELRHKQLAQAETLLGICDRTTNTLKDTADNDSSIIARIHKLSQELQAMSKVAPQLNNVLLLLQQAAIHLEEAHDEVQNLFSNLELDPQQLHTVEARIGIIHNLARKLRIQSTDLESYHKILLSQQHELRDTQESINRLEQALAQIMQEYRDVAQRLTNARQQAAVTLSAQIIERLKMLELQKAQFSFAVAVESGTQPAPHGDDVINCLISTNPGQPLGPLKKIASGGELSRVSLAIQVITAQRAATPTLIMDEVDVGISGKTAATVGSIMRELSKNAQIIAITHLPQVAANATHHHKVEKIQTEHSTSTSISLLDTNQRIDELARMMGGAEITAEARAHAHKLLGAAEACAV